MPSLSEQWKAAKAAWDDDESNLSPGTRFGLMFDPLAYIGGDKYRDFINKTGDQANLSLSKAIGSDDRGGWAANKPASTIGLMAAAYYGGGAIMGGGGGGGGGSVGSGPGGSLTSMDFNAAYDPSLMGSFDGFGGAANSGLGFFGNSGQAGLGSLGSGNVGQLFGSTGINTGGVAGVGGTGAQSMFGSMNPQQMMQMGQGMPGMQQPQQQQEGPKPYLYRGQIVWM